jgi:dipeptidase D
MRILDNIEPKKVFNYFEDICSIPHGSGNLDKISSYLEEFAKSRKLFCIRDSANNIIILKEASRGYEDREPIILQGHMDMVAVKTKECDIDLETEGLRIKTDGDYVYAEGTSLGGDDGIAVAYILAILASDDIKHPAIEAVITTEEETGMDGARAIDLSMLKSKRMLNIDSEEEGVLLTSCAGGMKTDCHVPVCKVNDMGGILYNIEVGGLLGGHSGTEIDKGRVNAIKLLADILLQLRGKISYNIVSIRGGEKDNAIPNKSLAVIRIDDDKNNVFLSEVEKIRKNEIDENKSRENTLFINVSKNENNSGTCFDELSTKNVVDFLAIIPNGVMTMSADIGGLVETSLNVGVLECNDFEIITSSAIRSSVENEKQKLNKKLGILAERFGGYTQTHGEYPGWAYNPNSKLRSDMVRIYKEMFGKDIKVEAIHAGLECGIMISKIPNLDCVSFGPDIFDIHTVDEKLSISSTQRTWNYLLKILEQ